MIPAVPDVGIGPAPEPGRSDEVAPVIEAENCSARLLERVEAAVAQGDPAD